MPEVKQTVHKCTLEWDVDRGVLYVHNGQGQTILRICRLPNSRGVDLTPVSKLPGQIDITVGSGI